MSESYLIPDETTQTIRKVARVWSVVIMGLGVLIFIMEIVESLMPNPNRMDFIPWYEYLIPFTLFTGVMGLVIAWRLEGMGGAITVVSVLINLATYYFIRGHENTRGLMAVIVILTPILIPGMLFLVCWFQSQTRAESQ